MAKIHPEYPRDDEKKKSVSKQSISEIGWPLNRHAIFCQFEDGKIPGQIHAFEELILYVHERAFFSPPVQT